MSNSNYEKKYTCRFWSPYTAAYADADYSIELKSFEVGNNQQRSRNQSIVRTRGGNNLVYDRGRNYDDVMNLQFRAMREEDKAGLVVFMDAVRWGATRLKMQDYKGNEYIIRVRKPEITYVDTGFMQRNDPYSDITLWDFDLEVLDLTDNSDATGEDALPPDVSDALAIHLADFDHPHNPQVSVGVNIVDGAKVIESLSVDDWKAITWIVVAELPTGARWYGLVSCENNGVGSTDATDVTVPTISHFNDNGGVFEQLTFTIDLNGSGSAQVMRLKCQVTTDNFTIRVRRVKL